MTTAIDGAYFRKEPSDSSASATNQASSSVRPSRALVPRAAMRAPTAKDGSAPAASSITAIIELVVVLPWVPATAIVRWTPMAAARASERCRTRSPRARAAASSGLDSRMAVEITTVSACSMFSAAWGTKTRAPFSRSASSTGPSLASEPDTLSPCSSSSSATADIPVPPMPMKCTRPSPDSCGRGGNGGFMDSGSRA